MEQEILLEKEKLKALDIIKDYNKKYKTSEYKKLSCTYEYLTELYNIENDNNKKKLLLEDINLIKTYL
jgi:hypothetical protein